MPLSSVQSVLTNGFEQIQFLTREQMTRIASGWQVRDPEAQILPREISNQVPNPFFPLAINPKRHGISEKGRRLSHGNSWGSVNEGVVVGDGGVLHAKLFLATE